jgi:hypothetical protein
MIENPSPYPFTYSASIPNSIPPSFPYLFIYSASNPDSIPPSVPSPTLPLSLTQSIQIFPILHLLCFYPRLNPSLYCIPPPTLSLSLTQSIYISPIPSPTLPLSLTQSLHLSPISPRTSLSTLIPPPIPSPTLPLSLTRYLLLAAKISATRYERAFYNIINHPVM